MITGNKGEWSELYVLLRVLAYGKIYAADDHVKKIEEVYFPILKVVREEIKGQKIEYRISNEEEIEVYLNNAKIKHISRDILEKEAQYLYDQIVIGGSRAFKVEHTAEFMQELECRKLSAPSTDKTDITLQIHDIHTGFEPICGFSIKSELGSSPTLLNASGATNFIYEVDGITDLQMEAINALTRSRSKIIDRMKEIFTLGKVKLVGMQNDKFSNNLMMIDSRMVELMGELLFLSYRDGITDCEKIIQKLEEKNPLEFPKKGFYEFKFKKLLCSIALGMMPSKEWDGQDEANGGYIIVSANGDVLAYHIYNRDFFEKYLLKSTKLDRGSTDKHKFASLYKKGNKMYMNLNLQIRFK